MRIVIDIPKEFESDFNTDRFSDCMNRTIADITYNLEHEDAGLSGNYEREIFEMLVKSFSNAIVLPENHGDLIDRKELYKSLFIRNDGAIMPNNDIDGFPITLNVKYVKQKIVNAPSIMTLPYAEA